MVLRGMDAPTTVTGRLNAADDRLDDLARAQARGTQAVRNDSGHKLALHPENPNPLVVASGGNTEIDSGLGFSQGTLQVVSNDGQQWRNIEASGLILHDAVDVPAVRVGDGGINTTGNVSANAMDATVVTSQGVLRGNSAEITDIINANGVNTGTYGIWVGGPAQVNGYMNTFGNHTVTGSVKAASGTLDGNLDANGANLGNYGMWSWGPLAIQNTVGGTAVNASNSMTTWNMTANGNVSLAGRAWNYIVSWVDTLVAWYNSLPSGADLKEGFAPVDDADADALLAAPVHRWSWAPWMEEEFLPPGMHGPRNLIDRSPDGREHYGPVAEDVPEIMQTTGEGGRLGIDLQSYAGLLLRICQRQQQQIDELTARVEALETAKGPARGA